MAGFTVFSVAFADEPVPSADQMPLRIYGETEIRFATVEEGQRVLTARDTFTENLSKFDLQVRLQTDAAVTLADWDRSVSREVIAWDKVDIERITASVNRIRPKLDSFRLPLPKTVLLVHTTGKEEADAAYTRANAIVLPSKVLNHPPAQLDSLLLHELFHVLSRHDRDTRRELYKIIGFELCEPIKLPPSLVDRKLTNPDAPGIDCLIELAEGDKRFTAAPILYSSAKAYDAQKGGSLFTYLTFRLLVVEQRDGKWQAVFHDEQPTVVDPRKLPGFYEKIGKNTGYIIHPDEILADNFIYLVTGKQKLETPHIVEQMGRILAK